MGALRQRDLFPLPEFFDAPSVNSVPFSKKSQRRLRVRLRQDALAADALYSLNSLLGHGNRGPSPARLPFTGHAIVRERILDAVKRLGECPVDLGPAEAFGELRGASVYEEDPSSAVQPLEPALVSLPEAGSLPKLLAEVCGTGGTEFVETFIEKALAKDTEVERALGEAPPEPYMDENLRARDGDYAHFITRLFGSGMVSYHREAGREQVGFFGVAKKNKKVRLAVDCRRSNAWFSKPAHVELSTGGALSALQVPPGENLYMGHYDIKNAFYTFALPPALNTYFSCPPVKAALLGLRELDGQRSADRT